MLKAFFVFVILYPAIKKIAFFVLSRVRNKRNWDGWQHNTAIVTGATGALGSALCRELIAKNMCVIGVGRRRRGLEDLREKHGTQFRYVVCDFAQQKDFSGLVSDIEKRVESKISLVFCTAATSHDSPKSFGEECAEKIGEILACNVLGQVRFLKAVFPLVDEHARIVMLGSFLGTTVSSLSYQTYGASKAFLSEFCNALGLEHFYAPKGAKTPSCEHVLCYYVCSKMSKIKRPSVLVPSAEAFAKCIVRTVGTCRENIPYLPHLLLWIAMQYLPVCILNMLTKRHVAAVVRKVANKKK